MADDMQELIALMNITIKGLEMMGSIAVTTGRGSAFVASRTYKVAECIGHTLNEKKKKTTGRISGNAMQHRFQDLRFSELPLLAPEKIYKELYSAYPGHYNPVKIGTLLNPLVLQAKFDRLAKKYGLSYAKMPNFIPDKQTGVIELRFAYPAAQTAAKEAVLAQMQAYIAKQLQKCGAKQEAARAYAEQQVPAKDTTFTESLSQIDLEKVTDEEFDRIMLETYPTYYLPGPVETIELSAERQSEIKQMLETMRPEKTAAITGRKFKQIEQQAPTKAKEQIYPIRHKNVQL